MTPYPNRQRRRSLKPESAGSIPVGVTSKDKDGGST